MEQVQACLSRLSSCIEGLISRLQQAGSDKELTSLGESTSVCLTSTQKGDKAEISRFCVSGEGTALASVDVEQESAYWEVEIVTTGKFKIGVAQRARPNEKKRLGGQLGEDVRSWGLPSSRLELKEMDTIGVYYDQRTAPVLMFSLNGEMIEQTISGVKSDCRPAASVEKSTILKFRFDEHSFKYPPKGKLARFSAIIPARNVL
mmetsp:Transcript_12100/g.19697  ORF Transcript_12100/g.19697 Transcript_12100/m.19697 type:complete len:204 (-) Transcript_12100:147-758(-)|eukprot:CAMPEP_0203795846 /NCGR_PEP_ID=MMETSP0100_2-20121128/7517_1 /ASSEMBLY_ACC=CAM_ASM_000210 /TAXON_ID=96639 /ORGANISM=" , Strain NY0313808BC1" /LENGTH=203 /DNA_ID=CAMNT_0050700521 /DNA_START=208 /DNA_END=819 /DNA_ORIENTATION=-